MPDLTMEFTDRLTVVTCWCGINHAVPANLRSFQERQHRDGEDVISIYCPLGHEHRPSGQVRWRCSYCKEPVSGPNIDPAQPEHPSKEADRG